MRLVLTASIVLLAMASGCNSLAPGDPAALRSLVDNADANAPAGKSSGAGDLRPTVLLFRGWRDLWSEGMDGLAEELRQSGQTARVFKQSQAGEVGDRLLAAYDHAAPTASRPLVLIGFSFGADEAIRISRRLIEKKHPVALLVLIDPVTPPKILPQVGRCVAFYQTNGAMDLLPWLRGVPVDPENDGQKNVQNVSVRDRPDLLEPDTSHKTIASNPKIHRAILELVRQEEQDAGWNPQRPAATQPQ